MVRDENFFSVQGFMRNRLNLKGNELMVYAIIYGFSQDGNQRFTGSSQYLADWIGTTRRSALNTLQSLVDKGLLQREEKFINNVKFVEYWCTELSHLVKKFHRGGEKFSQGGGEKFSHNNINNNNINNNIDNNNIYIPEVENPPVDIQKCVKHKYGEYKNVLLTDTDLEKLKTEFASDWQQRIEKLSIYKASTGKSYKNDLATIRNWARRDKERQQPVKKAVGEFVKGDLPF